MNTPQIAADYTTRKSYQQNYAVKNREAINARKRAWREQRKLLRAAAKPRVLTRLETDHA